MANGEHLAEPLPTPRFDLPDSSSIVDVQVIDTGTRLYINPQLFWEPAIPNFDGVHSPIYCFLVSHTAANGATEHVLFDLGVRSDWHKLPPSIVALISATTQVTPGSDVATVLDTHPGGVGVRSTDVSAIIWSHNHFDHIGNPASFPLSTELVVGPGVKTASWPGWPSKPDGTVLDADAEGRSVREIAFDSSLKIGRFDAFDYFGDGSFYLLDAPGHAVGHLCALARTSVAPPSFVFMGADTCHHAGVLRPSEYLPLPHCIAMPNCSENTDAAVCPGEMLQQLTVNQKPDQSFFILANGPLFPDHAAAMDTISKIQELDARDDVFVLIAHDLSLLNSIPFFPNKINSWRNDNIKKATRWLFCSDFSNCL